MTLTDKMIIFMDSLEAKGIDLSLQSGESILVEYYKSLGLKSTDTFSFWLMMTDKHWPKFGSVTRAIRKARERVPRWQKPSVVKASHIEDVKDEVGY